MNGKTEEAADRAAGKSYCDHNADQGSRRRQCDYGQKSIKMTLYVKAYLGNDRSDTRMYLDLYRKKVFRMTLEGSDLDVE